MFVQRKMDMDICLLILIVPFKFFKENNRLGQTKISCGRDLLIAAFRCSDGCRNNVGILLIMAFIQS